MQIVTIQLDLELLKFQRREYFRLSCVLPVSVKKVITLNVKADEEAVTNTKSEEKTACKEQEDIDNCKIVDISGGGIRLQSKKKYQKDDYMMLDFDLDIDGSISHKSIIGKVVESRANDNDGTLLFNVRLFSYSDDAAESIFQKEYKISFYRIRMIF